MAAFILKENRDRNRPVMKAGRERVEAAIAAHDRIQAISDEIRTRHGLEPVAESEIVQSWRLRLLELNSKPSKSRKSKPATVLTPTERLADLSKRRRQHRREGDALDAELRELIASREIPMQEIALAVGLTRQRVYQLAA